ncbi:MAG: ribosome small subunit-dependent GTPase A [Clostridia bacterium]|nr:ribosome small subunit-dependent GTPase A [Clostridia bacterium]
MIYTKVGKVVKGLGGLYETRVSEGAEVKRIVCRAKGNLKRDEEKVLIGDNVEITIDDSAEGSVVISSVLERKNSLIRPPLANLDYLFIVMATKKPAPVLETVDKLIAIAEHNNISPVVVITKTDLDGDVGEKYAEIYKTADIPVFVTSSESGEGTGELHKYIKQKVSHGKTAAFAGASGVGKSTLMNSLFPSLSLATSEISRKIERGRHTTRHVEIFDIDESGDTGYLADTPGFSLIDFARFDFFSLGDLIPAFRDIREYTGRCRYADCAHVGEGVGECAVARAAEEGKIAKSRLESYRSIYKTLSEKNEYK